MIFKFKPLGRNNLMMDVTLPIEAESKNEAWKKALGQIIDDFPDTFQRQLKTIELVEDHND